MNYLQGFEEISDRYDAYIFDIWGTLHNGQRIFPGTLQVLEMLRSKNKKIGILSNSPSRISRVQARMTESYQITPALYDAALTSGEYSHTALRDRIGEFHQHLGTKYYYIHGLGHEQNFTDLPYEQTDFDNAEFIILTRTLDFNETVEDYQSLLSEAANRRLPMVCCNPDRIVGVGDTLFICPGTVAAYYETLGGEVKYHGKPYSAVYQEISNMLGQPNPTRTLAIGDSFETDVRGGNRFGCDTLFLASGIHQGEINSYDPAGDIERLAAQFDARPTHVLDQIRW